MIKPAAVAAILDQYAKHDWTLRRILLTQPPPAELSEAFNGIPVSSSEIDALWFSRRSHESREAWELRRLTGSPFALVVVLDDDLSHEMRQEILSDTELEMAEASAAVGPGSEGH